MDEGEDVQPTMLVEGWALLEVGGDVIGYAVAGEHIIPVDGPSPYRVVALTEASTQVARPTKASARAIMRRMAYQTRRVTAMDCFERTLDFLAEMQKRRGIANGEEFTMPFSQESLASILGMSAVHLNRVLQRLRRDDYLRCHGKMWAVQKVIN